MNVLLIVGLNVKVLVMVFVNVKVGEKVFVLVMVGVQVGVAVGESAHAQEAIKTKTSAPQNFINSSSYLGPKNRLGLAR